MVSLILTQAEVLTQWYLSWFFDRCRNMRSIPVIQVTAYIQILRRHTLINNQHYSHPSPILVYTFFVVPSLWAWSYAQRVIFHETTSIVCQKNGWAIRYAPPLFRNSEEVCVRGSRCVCFNNEQLKRPGCLAIWVIEKGSQPNIGIPNHQPFQWNVNKCDVFVFFPWLKFWFFVVESFSSGCCHEDLRFGFGVHLLHPCATTRRRGTRSCFCDVIFGRLPLCHQNSCMWRCILLLNGWILNFVLSDTFGAWDKESLLTRTGWHIHFSLFLFSARQKKQVCGKFPDMLLETPFSFLLERTASH